MFKVTDKGEIEILPDFIEMKEVTFENGEIVKVVFRDAEEILTLRRHLTPLALDTALPSDNEAALRK